MYIPEGAQIFLSFRFYDLGGELTEVSSPYVVIFDAYKSVVQTVSLFQIQTGVCGFTWNTTGLDGTYFLIGFGESNIGLIRSDPVVCEVTKAEALTEYVSFEVVKQYLGGVSASEVSFVKSLISVASRLVENFTGKVFYLKKCVDVITFVVPTMVEKLQVKVRPLVSVEKIEVDDETFKDYEWNSQGLIQFHYTVWAKKVLVEYHGGFAVIPGEIKQAVLQIISILFRKRFVEGVATESILGHSYSWRDPAFRAVWPLIERYRSLNI